MFVLFVENRRKKEEKVIQRRICDELETAIPSHDQVAERKLLQREDVGVDCQSGFEMCEHDVDDVCVESWDGLQHSEGRGTLLAMHQHIPKKQKQSVELDS